MRTATSRRGWRALALATGLTLSLGSAVAPSAVANEVVPTCATPEVREAMVSQGLPSYEALARGKQTLVKYFLSRRQGCSATITVRSATLRLTSASAVAHPPVTAANASTLVELPPWELAPLANSNSDPLFVVPGDALTPAGLTDGAPYDVRFTVELVYDATLAGKKYLAQVATVSDVRGRAVSAKVERPAQPLRVLVVPMGNADLGHAGVFTDSARTALPKAMQVLHRMLPVADGIGSVEGESGGLRYSVAPSPHLVDLGPHEERTLTTSKQVSYLSSDGTYCGGPGSWSYVQQELAEARTAWNSVHPETQHVDRVLGVVAQETSKGQTTSGAFCADGYAAVSGREAWVRLVHTSAAPDEDVLAGYLTSLEVGHTLGAVAGPPGSSYHSTSPEADATARDRAYNVVRRSFLADDRPTMRYATSGSHDDNTLYEPADRDLAHCVLVHAAVHAACPGAVAVAGATSAGGGALHLSGRTDGTPSGTSAHTYVVDQGQDEQFEGGGPYFVELYGADGQPFATRDLPVSSSSSHHEHEGGSEHTETEHGVFDTSIDAQGAHAFTIMRRDGAGGSATELYRRQLDDAPTIESVAGAGGRTAFAATGLDEQDGDVSPDGRWVAWTEGDDLRIRRSDRSDGPTATVPGAREPDWSPDGTRLAAVRDGALLVVPVGGTSGDEARVDDAAVVYTPVARGRASSPSWSPDGSRIVVSLDDTTLMVIDEDGRLLDCVEDAECVPLLVGPASDPSWSPASERSPDGLIAYEQRDVLAGSGAAILTVEPGRPLPQRRVEGEDPAWGGGRLLFTAPDGIASLDGTTMDRSTLRTEPSRPGDRAPSSSADGTVLSVTGIGADGSDDVFVITPERQQRQVVASDDSPETLRLDVFVQCGASRLPVATALHGRAVDDDVVFDVDVDEQASCPGGRPVYRVTDGFQVTERTGDESFAGDAFPAVSVTAPRPGDVVDEGAPLPLDLDGWRDGERQPVTWRIDGDAGPVASGTSSSAETADVATPLPPGDYVLTASAAGRSTTVPFVVAADADRDGLHDDVDDPRTHACYPADARTSPTNAVTDYDGDLLVGRADDRPCTSAMNAVVRFDPQTVDLRLTDTPLTLTVTSSLDARALTAGDVRLRTMAGFPVDLGAVALTADRPDTFQVKFDRRAYRALALERGLLHGYVPVVVVAHQGGKHATGFDPRYPNHKS